MTRFNAPTPLPRARYRQFRSGGSVRISYLPEFDADPLRWIWDKNDPDVVEEKAWLDANAPGWHTEVVRKGFAERELPLGCDQFGTFMMYDVYLTFAVSVHRDAWVDWREAIQNEYRLTQERIERARATAPPGTEVCCSCGDLMVFYENGETYRLAQFAFEYRQRGHRCAGCGSILTSMDDSAALCDALDDAVKLVGLPAHNEEGWTDQVAEEWQRRQRAAPAVIVAVEPNMSAKDIMAALLSKLDSPAQRRSHLKLV